jgi:hypothetical protein
MDHFAVRKIFEILKQPDIESKEIVVPTNLVFRGSRRELIG